MRVGGRLCVRGVSERERVGRCLAAAACAHLTTPLPATHPCASARFARLLRLSSLPLSRRHSLAGAGTIAADVRRLFERVSSLRLSSKKMKYVFKRWLTWEQEHGNEQTVAHVKDRAREYVQLKAGGDDTVAVGDANAGDDDDGGAEEDEGDSEGDE
jgi:hypothetical protein